MAETEAAATKIERCSEVQLAICPICILVLLTHCCGSQLIWQKRKRRGARIRSLHTGHIVTTTARRTGTMSDLTATIARLLPNGLGARGDEERNPVLYPNRPLHLLLATSGSVASIKAPLIVSELLKVSRSARVRLADRAELRSPNSTTTLTSRSSLRNRHYISSSLRRFMRLMAGVSKCGRTRKSGQSVKRFASLCSDADAFKPTNQGWQKIGDPILHIEVSQVALSGLVQT